MPYLFDTPQNPLALKLCPWIDDIPDPHDVRIRERFSPQNYSADGLRAWIISLCEMFDTNPSSIARLAGLTPSTINKFLKAEGNERNLSASTIEDILGILIRGELSGSAMYADIWTGKMKYHLQDVYFSGIIRDGGNHQIRHFKGRPGISKMPVPVDWSRLPLVSFALNGSDYDPTYPPDTMVICAPIYKDDLYLPQSGDRYVIAEMEGNGSTRVYLREMTSDPANRSWLLPIGRSSETEPGLPLSLDNSYVAINGTEPKAIFKIISSVQPDPAASRNSRPNRS